MTQSDEPTCQSCGVPLGEHLGLYGTCRQLTEAQEEVSRLQHRLLEVGEAKQRMGDELIGRGLELEATITRIRALCQPHASPASNTGAHRLACDVLKLAAE